MTPQERQQLDDLLTFKRNLEASYTIPKNVEDALSQRLALALSVSGHSATSKNQAVNESGSASYSVLGIPNGFLQTTIAGVTYYIPYWTS